MATTFQKVLNKYRETAFSERDKGDKFERLMQAYLLTDPKYASKFKKVWLWNEFAGKHDLGGKDTGIDLVALTYEGDYWAVQCKCYQESSTIDKPAVDSFLATSSREFKDENMQTARFAQRLWISTTNRWGSNATEAIQNQNPPVTRINLFDLIEAPVDWAKLEAGVHGEKARTPKKTLRKHQKKALEKTHAHFKEHDRGKLIMACGTGKTFTALRIAEHETQGSGLVLFLVPSIALLGQTLREWSADANEPINAICICSDPEISKQKKKNDDSDTFSVVDLAYPASTDSAFILHQFEQIKQGGHKGMTVVFSTYQSIQVIAKAQQVLLKNGYPEFDLIICDEAHRTTGVSLAGQDESAFTKVHDADFIKAKKRLYMTATPRLYSSDSKSRAAEADAVLCSMDDEALYGEEMYRIGFGEAVSEELLTDYKVLILTLDDHDVPPGVTEMLTGGATEVSTDDLTKIIGTINALSKQLLGDNGETLKADSKLMKRAVAFCPNIKGSKQIAATYNVAAEKYLEALPPERRETMVTTYAQHMDGTMTAPERDVMLSWLKEETPENECRIITNVRVLSEGVDVPSLDSVLFLSARNSEVDVVQSVGRVMRRAPGKEYGYIIIPVVVPSSVDANEALDDNERYKVVWTVLNALRAHDDRFNATVNRIELNKKRPSNINVVGTKDGFDADGNPIDKTKGEGADNSNTELGKQLAIKFEQLQDVVFARMVKKVGDRRYWEDWAKEVAVIAQRQIEHITFLVENRKDKEKAFNDFLKGLQKNINPGITKEQAIEMLAQHIITKPIFEALFEGYSFTDTNAVSVAMQGMLSVLEDNALTEDSAKLDKFYESVRNNISKLDNAEAKQKIIIRIYDNFFKTAFPKMVEQLGIVYTPVEVVDFIIHSVNDVLKQEFGRSLSDENIHILDPFTGTGTFMTRLLQSGLIDPKDLERKYKHELHANELVLLAYYIAAVNIENAYHDLKASVMSSEEARTSSPPEKEGLGEVNEAAYEPFEGIVLTDTFQLGEKGHEDKLFSEMFPQNSARVARQKKAPLRVIIGNPPYSIGQKSANDNAQNQKYDKLDADIARTYAALSSAGLNKSLYDAYIKAFRWSTDRLDKNGGVIAFVSNGAWLDGNSTEGFRKSIEKEFTSIWVFNLRGNARTQGELRQKEAGNVFGGGSRTPISITLLVKDPNRKTDKTTIHYHDIGDYLSQQQKLDIIKKFGSVFNSKMKWKHLEPNEEGDWLNQRNEVFDTFISMAPEKKFDVKSQSIFSTYAIGVATNRDAWVYNFSANELGMNMQRTIAFYNEQQTNYKAEKANKVKLTVDDFIDANPTNISWTVNLKKDLEKGHEHHFRNNEIKMGTYRPFTKQRLYFDKPFIERPGLSPRIFPSSKTKNVVITISGVGASKDFSVLLTDCIPDLQVQFNGQYFPLYHYEERSKQSPNLFEQAGESEYIRRDGVSDFILQRAKQQYGAKNISKEDIFYYVYGFLHSPEYRTAFANDLKKMLPRLPLVEDVKDFWAFSKAGRALAELHINYEQVPPYEGVEVNENVYNSAKNEYKDYYKVTKMRFPKKGQEDTIIYNHNITITNIPEKAYEYVVNGKSAIHWIMERYQVKTDKKSGIKNDPNDWADEVGNPRYILDLLLSVINVSVQTVDIVEGLPKAEFETEN